MKNIILTVLASVIIVSVYFIAKRYYLKPRIENGVMAAEIRGKLLNGKEFSLSHLQGNYVLLDFWGSWCKPCRENHPHLIRLYTDFKEKKFKDSAGFEIVSFGVEKNPAHWKEAIIADSLPWKFHLASLDLFNDPVVKAYNVKQIPTKFLINPKGRIIAVDPSLDEVRKLLGSFAMNSAN